MKKWTKGMKKASIVFPNKKYGGVYALGPLILENLINKRKNWIAERVFLDSGKIDGDLVFVSLNYEGDVYNLKKMLKGVQNAILGGGYVISSNPELFKDMVDLVILGDVEGVIDEILDNYNPDKEKFLDKIKDIAKEKRCVKLNYGNYPLRQEIGKIDKNYVFGRAFMLEIERGCPYNCKFCSLAGSYGSVRYREDVKKIIDEGIRKNNPDRIVVISPSMTPPKRKEILKYIIDKRIRLSVPSLNVMTTDQELLKLIKKGGQKSVTFAVETDYEIRKEIGKNFNDERLFKLSEYAVNLGFNHIKYYFILGLPGQKSLENVRKLILKLKQITSGRMNLSFNPFVPKKFSDYENNKPDWSLVKKQMKEMQKFLRKNKIKYKFKSLGSAKKEYEILNLDRLD